LAVKYEVAETGAVGANLTGREDAPHVANKRDACRLDAVLEPACRFGIAMTTHDLDAMKQGLADLRTKVAAYDEQRNASEKAAAQVKEYRDFLENMTDRALKTFGLVIAVTAAALTLIGIKSFLEITDKAQTSAQERVQKYLSDHLIDSMIQERITEYQRAATIQYYVTQASSPSSVRIPPDPVLEKVLESTLTLAHRKYATDCASIIGSYDYFAKDPELAKRFGDLLLKLLTDSYGPDSVMLEDDAQTAIVAALGKLGRKDTGPALWKLFKDDRAPDGYRMAFARNLRSLLSSEELFRQIVSDMPRVKGHKTNSYNAELVAILLASPDDKAGLQELQNLAKDQSWAYSDTLITVINEVFVREDGGFESNASDQSVGIVAKNFFYPLVLSGRLYFAIEREDTSFRMMSMTRQFQRRRRFTYTSMQGQTQLDLWLKTSESAASGLSGGESFLSSGVFAALLTNGLGDPNAANRAKVVHSIVMPLAGYLADTQKEDRSSYYAAAIHGELNVSAELQVPEAKGQKLLRVAVSEFSKDGETVDLLAYPEQDDTPIRIRRKISDIDLSKVAFIPGIEE
jgi:hypothetical protein